MKKLIISFILSTSVALLQLPVSFDVYAADAPKAEKKKRKVYLPGPSVGKKVGKAFEAYTADDLDGAIAILEDIKAKKEYDIVFVNFFTGQMYAQKGDSPKSISYLSKALKPDMLSEADQGNGLRLLADLQMQKKQSH